jgi:PiT family inorganic phosphate transporter
MFGLDPGLTILLFLCIIAACTFEFINGFHDTANAVATVIYTNSLKPTIAVIWSGIFNFIGVYVGGIAVAMGIVELLPSAIHADQEVSSNIAMVLSIIIAAIIWNLGTWYFGIPCSSSHTLLGSIFGVGLAYILIPGSEVVALNWNKVKDVGLSLMISPLIGFGLTMALVIFLKKKAKSKKLFDEPHKKKAPPFWIRSILVLTCTSVSFSHGSNDGQKGVGLIMIILIAIIPAHFAVNHTKHPENLLLKVNQVESIVTKINVAELSVSQRASLAVIEERIDTVQTILSGVTNFEKLEKSRHHELRSDIRIITKQAGGLIKVKPDEEPVKFKSEEEKSLLEGAIKEIKGYTDYAPVWVILIISLSLGIGTMIGWKRIVVTIGEKIGKEHLTYAQGASAELVAATTIQLASHLGLPVSTTHVLSSGVAGSMVATNGLKNLRMKTVKNILIAWLVTLPVTIVLSGGLFLLIRLFL